MICTIAKTNVRTQKYKSILNMGVSKVLYMYIINLIIMAFNIIIKKHQNMLNINDMKSM